ncbi:putative uncharacterized protein [Waddlia chondrophila 2032/99]|nr:putative uncharacterized protein [Waddlia chondrophila 2032/99]
MLKTKFPQGGFMTTQSVKEKDFVFSSSEFPRLSEGIPGVVQEIDQLHSAVLKAHTIEKVRILELQLGERIRELSELFTQLFDTANEVSKLALPLFNKNKGRKGAWQTEAEARKKAIEAHKELDALLKKQVSYRLALSEVTVTPNYLPQVQDLSSSLIELSNSLQELMTEALNPSQQPDIEKIKLQLAEKRERFEELGAQVEGLEDPVARKAIALDKHIEETREHTGMIAINKAVCKWGLTRINIFVDILSNIVDLQKKMAGLSRDAENLKTYLRENPYTSADPVKLCIRAILNDPGERTLKAVEKEMKELLAQYPETISSGAKKALLSILDEKPETKITEARDLIEAVVKKLPDSPIDNATRDFAAIVRVYNESKSQAEAYREVTEKAIDDLSKLIENEEKNLIATIKGIPFHDPSVLNQISKQMEEAISRMQGERKTLLYKLKETWKAITEQLSTEQKGQLLYEINRLGYAIHENHGALPRDFTYGRLWSINNPYVESMATKST